MFNLNYEKELIDRVNDFFEAYHDVDGYDTMIQNFRRHLVKYNVISEDADISEFSIREKMSGECYYLLAKLQYFYDAKKREIKDLRYKLYEQE